jgi:hypothetical protein
MRLAEQYEAVRVVTMTHLAACFFPEGRRKDCVFFFANPSDDGGLLELWLFFDSRASSSATRARSWRIRSTI